MRELGHGKDNFLVGVGEGWCLVVFFGGWGCILLVDSTEDFGNCSVQWVYKNFLEIGYNNI